MRRRPFSAAIAMAALLLSSCGGGGGDGGNSGSGSTPTPPTQTSTYSAPAAESLSAADVGAVISQAVAEAKARGLAADIAVTDRVGNVLAVFQMAGALSETRILDAGGTYDPNPLDIDLQGKMVPSAAAAIAKAVTASYLSSGGNAFTTRTASEIVQDHFPPSPSATGLESGPLFGVQFSQLPCSDLSARYAASDGTRSLIGPKTSPLGLSADPGGIPLYKNGVLVGGIGIEGDGRYGADLNILDVDQSDEEYAALAGSTGFAAPDSITADKVTVDGTALRFIDATPGNLRTAPASAPAFSAIPAGDGSLIAVDGYYSVGSAAPALLAGQVFGTEASGVRKATTAEFNDVDGYVLSDGAGHNRFPIRGAADGAEVSQPLSQTEVAAILQNAFAVMRRARAQIRSPLNSRAQVSISVVDTFGTVLGVVRSPDAPVFGTDVSLQKARTAAFFSGAHAGSDLSAFTNASSAANTADVRNFVVAARAFFNDQTALTGRYAFTDRANGNISRPHFPDGQEGAPNGPFSRPIAQFNPFSTGLQSALILNDLSPARARCATGLPDSTPGLNRVQNGIQIFPGSVPIYRGSTLVGGVGVSGDGIDQDDLIAFLGLYNAGQSVGSIGEAPSAIRADQIVVNGIRLRYVGCPTAPFLDTSDQNVCDGK